MSWAERLVNAWYQGHPALCLLRPLEWLYRAVVRHKRRRFVAGLSPSYRAPVPVIVVGNITVGGTGKTPLILYLIEHCRARGLRVGVVSRGYGAQPPSLPWRVTAEQSAREAGDEPLLLVQRSGVALMIDPDRARAVRALLSAESLDLILCDDGLQHYRLARDLEMVLIDAACRLGRCVSHRSVCNQSMRCCGMVPVAIAMRVLVSPCSRQRWSMWPAASVRRWIFSRPGRPCMPLPASVTRSVSSAPLRR